MSAEEHARASSTRCVCGFEGDDWRELNGHLAGKNGDRSGASNGRWNGGATDHPLYWTYHDMFARCERETHQRYEDYGGRGIAVCERWRESFWTFVDDMGDRPAGRVLDRIDNDGDYRPDNCRWATLSQSSRNRRRTGWRDRDRDSQGRFV